MKLKHLLIAVSLLTAGTVFAAPFTMPTQWSATMVTTAGGKTTTMKEYYDQGKMRSEINAGGQNMISITRPDKKLTYTVMVAQKMYMQTAYNTATASAAAPASNATFTKVGTEAVEGHQTDKMSMTVDKKPSGIWWVDQKTNWPVKYQSVDGKVTMVYKDFKSGPQAASLFEPPAGFKKMGQ